MTNQRQFQPAAQTVTGNTGNHGNFHIFQTIEDGVTFGDIGNHFLSRLHAFELINIRADNKVIFFAAKDNHALDVFIFIDALEIAVYFIEQT